MGGHEKYASFNGKQKSCVLLAKPSGALLWLPRRLPKHRTAAARQVSASLPQETHRKAFTPPPPLWGVHEGPFSKLHDDGVGKQTRQTDSLLLKEPSKRLRSSGDDRTSWKDGRKRGCFAEGASIRKSHGMGGCGLVNARRN